MAYFSQKAVEIGEQIQRRSVRSYVAEDTILQFILEDLVARLDALNEKRPHDPLNPVYDRCFYEDGIRRYYEMPDTVQGLLSAIDEIKRLIKFREAEGAERERFFESVENTGANPDGQLVIICFFAPFLSRTEMIA